VRRKKSAIRSRVKGDLPIVFTDEKLSAYGGIELFRRFIDRSGFSERLQKVFSIRQFDGDYGSLRITLALIGMLLLGGTRLRSESWSEIRCSSGLRVSTGFPPIEPSRTR
jgi:hypothetical protein